MLTYDMVGMLQDALEKGDTRYQEVPLFTLDLPAVSQRRDFDQRKAQLSRLNARLLQGAGIINVKNTHICRTGGTTATASWPTLGKPLLLVTNLLLGTE